MLVRTLVALAACATSVFAGEDGNCTTFKGDGCPAYRVFCVRGTREGDFGCGEIGIVAKGITDNLPGADCEAVDYPAAGIDDDNNWDSVKYARSERQGISDLLSKMVKFKAKCRTTPMALIGYSQGAHVVGDILCGRTSQGFSATTPISAALGENVKAILQLGDPTSLTPANTPWHKGNSTAGKTGLFPRKNYTPCSKFSDRWQSWCDSDTAGLGDFFCGNGKRFDGSIPIHLEYVQNHGAELIEFVTKALSPPSEGETGAHDYELK